jgi:purine nucleoside transport protein
MLLAVNIFGIFVFIAVAWAASKDRKHVDWKSVGILLGLEVLVGALLTILPAGRDAVNAVASGFSQIIEVSYSGISFALGDLVPESLGGTSLQSASFLISALMPILMIVPLFDILTYLGVLPFVIKWIGRGLSFITRRPKFETFYSIEMMFLGNSEAIAVSRYQIQKLSPLRNVTIAMMSMSCVTAAILGAYLGMMGEAAAFVLTAVPLNILGALIISTILNPVEVKPEEDVIVGISKETTTDAILEQEASEIAEDVIVNGNVIELEQGEIFDSKSKKTKPKREPFFSFLGDSIISAGKIILIILANVVAFVALAALINKFFSLTTLDWLTLENIFGVVMFPFASLLGLEPGVAFEAAQLMGTKLVTNEFVAMGQISSTVSTFAPHYQAIIVTFLTSFANISTIGLINGTFKTVAKDDTNVAISKEVPRIFLCGVLVSLLSAGIAGLFIW